MAEKRLWCCLKFFLMVPHTDEPGSVSGGTARRPATASFALTFASSPAASFALCCMGCSPASQMKAFQFAKRYRLAARARHEVEKAMHLEAAAADLASPWLDGRRGAAAGASAGGQYLEPLRCAPEAAADTQLISVDAPVDGRRASW